MKFYLKTSACLVALTPTSSFQFQSNIPFTRNSKNTLHLIPMHAPAIEITTPKLEISPTQMESSIQNWMSLTIATAPTQDEIKLLQDALGVFYNEKDYKKAEMLLNNVIDVWQRQSSDEKAALYRIRGDCYMELDILDSAIRDYAESITLLQTPEAKKLADPNELPTSYLGRARAIRSLPKQSQTPLLQTAISDYEKYLILTARDGQYMDNDEERIEDGILRNPYAGWEYAATLRSSAEYKKAGFVREQASTAFDYIGDTAHSVISYIDYGIDLAMGYSSGEKVALEEVQNVLTKGIESTTKVEGRDIRLLQHVVSKEGEGRLALASILWNEKNIPVNKAENILGDACIRLEQLEQDNNDKFKKKQINVVNQKVLKFSIDGSNVLDAGEISCSKFRNEKFVSDVLGWPAGLREKVRKLETLKR